MFPLNTSISLLEAAKSEPRDIPTPELQRLENQHHCITTTAQWLLRIKYPLAGFWCSPLQGLHPGTLYPACSAGECCWKPRACALLAGILEEHLQSITVIQHNLNSPFYYIHHTSRAEPNWQWMNSAIWSVKWFSLIGRREGWEFWKKNSDWQNSLSTVRLAKINISLLLFLMCLKVSS